MECSITDIPCHVEGIFQKIKDKLFDFFEWQLDLFITLLSYIPVPDWMQNVGSLSLPDGVLWFASAFELQAGFGIMASAWVLRFIIRRLPFIG